MLRTETLLQSNGHKVLVTYKRRISITDIIQGGDLKVSCDIGISFRGKFKKKGKSYLELNREQSTQIYFSKSSKTWCYWTLSDQGKLRVEEGYKTAKNAAKALKVSLSDKTRGIR
ncbi:hypothetical protein [Escherichia coli]|uniref:hypothetical protein n=1 Tax=Escherichia coli TaxID=562 RepID=UPI001CA7A7C0|nr:hypothetical protein [Escherichia coli]QZY67681.1 hypothetical protein K7X33_16435 [Escherichia coli]